ncbi:EAL domain-containing protein [Sideroxydans sp. CL21]|uniref:EAL domain-containing protein n=1 Tax=Sideroxydans sp. CL21 TaxID=2600596 RepID=UPI0012A7A961|nr:EAL domain-containing protein [Sideroxydans sp. CL21]VVC83040.1 diguanylate cyclase/phosphodiesterase (GGDEF & EAL domains) with PAS/PAC sensor(s) [Sideroxydans sp. CL21]
MNAKFLHLTSSPRSEHSAVRQLSKFLLPVDEDTTCMEVLRYFLSDAKLYALPVVDKNNIPVGLIDRHVFVEYFTRQYVPEIHGKKPVLNFLKEGLAVTAATAPIIIDEATCIDDVAQMIIGAGMQHMVTGFIVTGDGEYLGVANGHDLLNEITLRKQADLYFLAHFDHLTGLPNRMLFGDRLMQACRDALRNNTLVGLMFVDVDRFKQVNDSLGHGFGDMLLCSISERLKSCARESDTVARLGGDEFAILMDNLKETDDPVVMAQRIVDSMQEPLQISGHSLLITVSIGIAIYPTDDTDVTALLTKADTAMYEAKSSGRNGYRIYAPGLSMYNSAQMSLDTELRSAVRNNEFVLHYQPKVSLNNGQVIGVEALIRWQHPTRGLLSPVHFIPLAEENGVIVEIGNWVLRQACIQHCQWNKAGLPSIHVAVNVSALQFRKMGFIETVKSVFLETGIDPRYIEIELTESTLMQNAAGVLETLNELKAIGVRLSIDDFGTGYSNLNYLKQFPIDCLKIDQSFIRDIDTTPVNESIVRAIVALANSMSMQTIAEGTESQSELDVVKRCLCDVAQGYHYAKPLAPDDFSKWLNSTQKFALPDV